MPSKRTADSASGEDGAPGAAVPDVASQNVPNDSVLTASPGPSQPDASNDAVSNAHRLAQQAVIDSQSSEGLA
ncbi:hypothetical protein SAMN05421771_3817 [Granulicella pectinivorans]|jgi:hypothetical protein|uniref:Uncharacterized protein n=1 Tax=Granulicella pectinivorans TaxID=474950 RepID=A0A1I6MYM3_9BACT|nr:hypothetical protein SAMN05421771_3817 [Granulicella pectinivorans]